jgi:hypothetical protein
VISSFFRRERDLEMFDPTAFDNLKVVLEGAVYDLDLTGEISITGRRDLFNFASYERFYEIEFIVSGEESFTAVIELSADMKNFLAERQKGTNRIEAGAELEIRYTGAEELLENKEDLMSLWGSDKQWEWKSIHSSVTGVSVLGILTFQRLITETMVDDLLDIVTFTIDSLRTIKKS